MYATAAWLSPSLSSLPALTMAYATHSETHQLIPYKQSLRKIPKVKSFNNKFVAGRRKLCPSERNRYYIIELAV